ncbi:MAG: MBL fold metallo-hydrolase [Kofleriaceae bacterium]|nr:MBL fold metallo-hydrolase [Kofleriaceae bacterium]
MLTYLGVAGWQIEGGGKTILVDPYFTRPASFEGVIQPDPEAIAKHAPTKADLIVIGHSHIDHLLDAPTVALKTGAQLMGSESTIRVGRASGVPDDRLVPIKGGEDYAFDGFSVRVLPSLHSALDHKHTLGKAIAEDIKLPLTFAQYEEGGTFMYLLRLAGHEILIGSTANFIERELAGIHPDIAILAPGLREEIYDYSCRLMRVLANPDVVYVTHFDMWREPPPPAGTLLDESDFVNEIKACSPSTTVIVPRHFERMTAG